MARPPTATKPAIKTALPPARSNRGLQAVGVMASKITRPILGKAGLAEGDIVANWAVIVGATLASHSLPERIVFPKGRREAGEITVRVSAGAFAVTLQHDIPRVLERLNGFFGYRAVDRVKIVQGAITRRTRPLPTPIAPLSAPKQAHLTEQLAGIMDMGLRDSLERLGRAILAGKPDS